jgi:hypothetical protein
MNITDAEWAQDRLGRCALDLRLDGQPAHISSNQLCGAIRAGTWVAGRREQHWPFAEPPSTSHPPEGHS